MADQRSFATRVGDGSTKNFTFSFAYFDKNDLQVYVDGQLVTAWVLGQGGNVVSLATAPIAGAKVTIKRVTPTTPKVTYKDGAVLTNEQLNLSQQQTLYLTEEAKDRAERAIEQHEGDYFDAKGLTIRNAGEPTDPSDLINKAYHDDVWIPQMNSIKDQTQQIKDSFQPEVDAAVVKAQGDVQAVADVNEFIIEGIRDDVFDAKTDVINRQAQIESAFDTTTEYVTAQRTAVDVAKASVDASQLDVVAKAAQVSQDALNTQADVVTTTQKAIDSATSAAQAQAFRNEAQGFRTEASTSADEAKAAESGAVALFGTLENLDTRLTNATNAELQAGISRDEAVSARNAALIYRDETKVYKDTASTKATEAALSAAEALASKTATQTLNDEAQVYRDQAATVQTDLFAARDLCLERADDAEAAKLACQTIQTTVNAKVGVAETARIAAQTAASDAALSSQEAQATADSVVIQQEVLNTAVSSAEGYKNQAQQAAASAESVVASVDKEAITSATIIYSILFG